MTDSFKRAFHNAPRANKLRPAKKFNANQMSPHEANCRFAPQHEDIPVQLMNPEYLSIIEGIVLDFKPNRVKFETDSDSEGNQSKLTLKRGIFKISFF